MLRNLLLAILSICITHSVQAQTALRLHAGLSQGYLNHEYILDAYREQRYSAPLSGLALGLGLRWLDKGLFSLGSDIYYFQSGGRDNDGTDKDSNIFETPDQLRTTYLSAATVLNISPLRGRFRIDLGVGPRVDFMVGGQNTPPLRWYKDNGQEGVAKVNVGATGVLGLSLRAGRFEYGLTATYVNRFRPLLDVPSELRSSMLLLGGARSREQSLLFCLTLARQL
jgi:hypothetical protein